MAFRKNEQTAFQGWIRTGQLPAADGLISPETKFNPWHDERGRFTFSPDKAGMGTVPQAPIPARPAATRQASPGSAPRRSAVRVGVRAVPGYPREGKNAWRAANDAVFQQASDDFNRRNGLKPGDERFVTPQFMKAWAMVESGGKRWKQGGIPDRSVSGEQAR